MSTLWNEHPNYCVSLPDPYAIRPAEASATLAAIRDVRPDALACRLLGRSAEGREIVLAEIGAGSVATLAWSQMHGDEPTHTAVLLDLLNFLQRRSDHPTAATILKHLRLSAIVVLNPDGAERQTRQNAQGIDINRDALTLASPEARVLHDAVLELKPHFAFNLHNHNPRRMVADTGEPAAVALLTPPVDAIGNCPDHMLVAQQVAALVRQAAETHAPGTVARYGADFMPRAFGEWVQQQGVATLLIEAGGWSTLSAEPLRRLHFVLLSAALAGIADGDYRQADVSLYTSLPAAGDNDLFDFTLVGSEIATTGRLEPYRADLGINASGTRLQADDTLREARIAAVGDLHITRGKTSLAGDDAICTPGRVAWCQEITPERWPTRDEQQVWVQRGATTLLGTIDLTAPDDPWDAQEAALRRGPREPLLLNLGWVATADSWSAECTARLATTALHGVVAVAAEDLPRDVDRLIDAWRLARLSVDDRDGDKTVAVDLPERSDIALGAIADLAITGCRSRDGDHATVDWLDLRQVIVGGTVVLDRGKILDVAPGVLLASR